MLASLLGIRLILLLGKKAPLPASAQVMNALSRVRVINDSRGDDGFQLTFTLGKDKLGDYALLRSGVLDPDSRVSIGVLLGVMPEPLIDGIIYHHQVTPGSEPGTSQLTVSGRNLSVLLDLEERNAEYKNRPDFLIATEILTRPEYTQYGIVPQAMPTSDVPIELLRVPRQQETDLRFLQRMAARNGFVFYIEPLTLGVSRAYFGPENRVGQLQSALSIDMGSATNLEDLNFSTDALSPVGTKGVFVEPITKTSIPIPPLPSLRIPPLALSPTAPRRTRLMRSTARQNPAEAATNALATATNSPDSVKATGKLETVRYGYVLRARRLVGVRGAGLRHDGFYKVSKVTHDIEAGKYSQSFELSREGSGALLPVVVP